MTWRARARRLVEDLPAGVPEAVAPVEVLHVEPVALVEQADLAHRLGPAEHEGAVDRVDLARLVVAQLRRPVLAERAGGAVCTADPGEVGEGAERGGERALAGVIELAGLGDQLHADHADPLLAPEPRQRGVERARVDLGVGVEQQHGLGLALAQGEVVGGGEADVGASEQPHRRELALDHGGRRVGAAAVDDGDPHPALCRMLLQRAQAVAQQPFGAMADDDDFELRASCSPRRLSERRRRARSRPGCAAGSPGRR